MYARSTTKKHVSDKRALFSTEGKGKSAKGAAVLPDDASATADPNIDDLIKEALGAVAAAGLRREG